MGTDKPLIAILMAVYHPKVEWLVQQLDSLNAQTYPNLRLYVRDDGPDEPVDEKLFAEHITTFPYSLVRNEKNLGSNLSFERLTQEAEGEYFAYCDQDDIWLPEKLEILEKSISESGAQLVCSDMYIIDGEGRRTADSITKIRRHHVFRSGENLAEGLIFRNFVTGCTMLVRADTAKRAVPFCPYLVHDQYIALWCAAHGKIISLPRQLINYRVHGNNQTGIMNGVKDKASYKAVRIDTVVDKILWLKNVPDIRHVVGDSLDEGLAWAQARQKHFSGEAHQAGTIRKYRKFGTAPAVFEIACARLPERVFMWVVSLVKKNLL